MNTRTGRITVEMRTGQKHTYAVASQEGFCTAATAFRKRDLVTVAAADGSEHAFHAEDVLGLHWTPGEEELP